MFKNIYVYPISNPSKSIGQNPYVKNLIASLEESGFNITNKNRVTKYGVLDIIFNTKKNDIYYFNWIENIPEKRFGYFQCAIFTIILFYLKFRNKQIIWMIHNKISHNKKRLLCKIFLNYLLINNVDILLTHSREGVIYGNTLSKKKKEIYFMHHPIEDNIKYIECNSEKSIDILIWGSIYEYKGIDTFLEYLKSKSILEKYKIHIVGKIATEELKDKLFQYSSDNIVINDVFIEENMLVKLYQESKVVLFTYAGYSTLSSGALMDTLSYGSICVGPNIGAFRDLGNDKLIYTYNDFDDLIFVLDNLPNKLINIDSFISKNKWENFSDYLVKIIKMNDLNSRK